MDNEAIKEKSIDTDQTPKIYGELWTIAENWSKQGIIDWDKEKYKNALFLEPLQIEGSIRGNDLFEFFKEKNTQVLNANVWEYLKDNNEEIPEEWKTNKKGNSQYIFFWGTIDRSPDGNLYIRYLSWSGGNWVSSTYLLSGNWHEDFPAALFVK